MEKGKQGEIRVYRGRHEYMLNFHRASNADRVFELFGTYVLSSAFLSEADPVKVEANISRLNPADAVIMDIY